MPANSILLPPRGPPAGPPPHCLPPLPGNFGEAISSSGTVVAPATCKNVIVSAGSARGWGARVCGAYGQPRAWTSQCPAVQLQP